MKNYSVAVLGCIIMLLSLFGCDNGIPVPGPEPNEVTMTGFLDVAEDFYMRNKPEPVVIEYNVKLTDTAETACEMTIGVKVDLFRFDAATGTFVPEHEQPLVESSHTVACDGEHDGTINWIYDRQANATTYKIILEATMEGYDGTFSVASDLFVIWKSPGAPKGHAKRDLKKMDQVEKLITKLDGYHGVYEAALDLGYIVGDELVVIHDEIMTVDEAVAMAETFEMNAVYYSDLAIKYFYGQDPDSEDPDVEEFVGQDYETCFILAKKAAREAHSALTIYHALLAQARDMYDFN